MLNFINKNVMNNFWIFLLTFIGGVFLDRNFMFNSPIQCFFEPSPRFLDPMHWWFHRTQICPAGTTTPEQLQVVASGQLRFERRLRQFLFRISKQISWQYFVQKVSPFNWFTSGNVWMKPKMLAILHASSILTLSMKEPMHRFSRTVAAKMLGSWGTNAIFFSVCSMERSSIKIRPLSSG